MHQRSLANHPFLAPSSPPIRSTHSSGPRRAHPTTPSHAALNTSSASRPHGHVNYIPRSRTGPLHVMLRRYATSFPTYSNAADLRAKKQASPCVYSSRESCRLQDPTGDRRSIHGIAPVTLSLSPLDLEMRWDLAPSRRWQTKQEIWSLAMSVPQTLLVEKSELERASKSVLSRSGQPGVRLKTRLGLTVVAFALATRRCFLPPDLLICTTDRIFSQKNRL
jgi:hypothetical protein